MVAFIHCMKVLCFPFTFRAVCACVCAGSEHSVVKLEDGPAVCCVCFAPDRLVKSFDALESPPTG